MIQNLFFVFEYCPNGDLQAQIQGKVDREQSQIYAAQIFSAIESVHKAKIIHRDLKPENVLLDSSKNVKLADFGTSLICEDFSPDLRQSSIVGTPIFVAPEILEDGQVCYASDLWAFGCLLFNLLTGQDPFVGSNEAELMQNIVDVKLNRIELFEEAKDLIDKLLKKNPSERLGFNEIEDGYQSIKNHQYFKGLNWLNLLEGVQTGKQTNTFLTENETIIQEGIIEKKQFLSWKPRSVFLTSNKRFLIFKSDNSALEDEILLTKEIKTETANKGKEFHLITSSKKSFAFRCNDGTAELWVANITKTIFFNK